MDLRVLYAGSVALSVEAYGKWEEQLPAISVLSDHMFWLEIEIKFSPNPKNMEKKHQHDSGTDSLGSQNYPAIMWERNIVYKMKLL